MRTPTRILAAVVAAATLLSPAAADASDLGAPAAADSAPAAAESGQVVYIGAGQTLSLVRYNRSSYRRTPHLRLLEAPSAPVRARHGFDCANCALLSHLWWTMRGCRQQPR